VPEGWPVAEYPGATVLPGLIDCHVHLCADSRTGALDRLPGYSDEQLGQVIEAALRAQLAAGVTTVRDLAGSARHRRESCHGQPTQDTPPTIELQQQNALFSMPTATVPNSQDRRQIGGYFARPAGS
jgi:predicted amidohydrolase YtcJ